ncbi:helix-turn-helix domain-containing protein [Streptomyces sp. 2323.1]|uniref:helix-turn-helix domain-containing protein n=1 Tax=Streptomyces sp. 2323.1 TaxID=1938841 RepID=UPI000BB769CE|nr:XRE family transcriptional regulator [Streptomyces sp. 2323.1]
MSTPSESGPTMQVIERLGREVRRRRQAAGLTVQGLADSAGLSRRMLTQIEQGTANPSLVTIDKIARALGVDFAALTAPPATEPLHVSEAVEVWSSPAGSRALLHVASARRGGPELWEWTLQPGDRYQAQPDPPGSEELILVSTGTLLLETEERLAALDAGASARLASDRPYAYAAPEGGEPAIFVRVVEAGDSRTR